MQGSSLIYVHFTRIRSDLHRLGSGIAHLYSEARLDHKTGLKSQQICHNPDA
jgi:hypothetical protein